MYNIELMYGHSFHRQHERQTGLMQCPLLPPSVGIAFSDFLWRLDSSPSLPYSLRNTHSIAIVRSRKVPNNCVVIEAGMYIRITVVLSYVRRNRQTDWRIREEIPQTGYVIRGKRHVYCAAVSRPFNSTTKTGNLSGLH